MENWERSNNFVHDYLLDLLISLAISSNSIYVYLCITFIYIYIYLFIYIYLYLYKSRAKKEYGLEQTNPEEIQPHSNKEGSHDINEHELVLAKNINPLVYNTYIPVLHY